MMRIANNYLKQLLKEKNMTQTQLSKLTNIPISTLNDYINGKSKITNQNLMQISNVLDVSSVTLTPSWQNYCALKKQIMIKNEKIRQNNEKVESFVTIHDFTAFFVSTNVNVFVKEIELNEWYVIMEMPMYHIEDVILVESDEQYTVDLKNNINDTDTILGKLIAKLTLFN